MQISNNKVVLLEYELKLSTGELVDSADEKHPFAFIHGTGQTIPAFDEKLIGLEVGNEFEFHLPCDEAYGQANEADIATIPKEIFGNMPEDELKIGIELPMQDGEGHQFYGVVKEIQPQFIVMDFNHPLVGQDLYFSGKVLSIRMATEEELAHGHVHGEGGHHH